MAKTGTKIPIAIATIGSKSVVQIASRSVMPATIMGVSYTIKRNCSNKSRQQESKAL